MQCAQALGVSPARNFGQCSILETAQLKRCSSLHGVQNRLRDASTQQEMVDMIAVATRTSSAADDKIRSAYSALWLGKIYFQEDPQEVRTSTLLGLVVWWSSSNQSEPCPDVHVNLHSKLHLGAFSVA